jgi:hypothetical protein
MIDVQNQELQQVTENTLSQIDEQDTRIDAKLLQNFQNNTTMLADLEKKYLTKKH